MSNQSLKQASVRAVTGTTSTYEGDWHALFDLDGIPVGTFNGRLLAWINQTLGASYTEINGAMNAFAVDRGFSSWDSMGTFDASGTAQPLRFIATQNRGFTGSEARAGLTAQAFNWAFKLAADSSAIVITHNAWSVGSTAENPLGNTITIQETALIIGSTVVPFYYSGNRSVTLANDAIDIQSDPIPASAFGLSKFDVGTLFYIKGWVEVPSGGKIPYTVNRQSDWTGGTQQAAQWFDPASTTISSTDVAGAYTVTAGTAFSSRVNGYRPTVLGRPVSDSSLRSYICFGDSIAESVNDNNFGMTTTSDPMRIHGMAFVCRSSRSDADDDYLAIANYARSGTPSTSFSSGTRCKAMMQYARGYICGPGTNNMSTTPGNNTALQNSLLNIWAAARTAGIEKIVRCYFQPYTSSTDSFLTEANQTYANAASQAGGNTDLMQQWFDTKLADNTIDAVAPLNSVRGTDPFKWLVDGVTTQYTTTDGQHPSGRGHEFMATDLRPVLRSLF